MDIIYKDMDKDNKDYKEDKEDIEDNPTNTILKTYRDYYYPSISKLYNILKKKYTIQQIKDVISKEETYQLHNKNTQFKNLQGNIVSFAENQFWNCDIIDLQNLYKTNKGNRYILIVVDIFTRYCYAEPLTNKNSDTVLNAFKVICNKKSNSYPDILISDNGSEFISNIFQKYLKDHQIIHKTFPPGTHTTLGIIDRLCKTIKNNIFKYFTENETTTYIDVLDDIIQTYNLTPHTSLNGLSPYEAQDIEHKDMLRIMNQIKYNQNMNISDKLNIGDLVRKKLKKTTYDKGYKQQWSKRIYNVVEISNMTVTLDNGDDVKITDIQKVEKPNENKPPKKDIHVEIQKAKEDYKKEIENKREGINFDLILTNKRERKKNTKYDKDYVT